MQQTFFSVQWKFVTSTLPLKNWFLLILYNCIKKQICDFILYQRLPVSCETYYIKETAVEAVNNVADEYCYK